MEIFTDWMGADGVGQMLSRFGHYLAGITWIGLLYYFNFVQVPAFAEMEPPARSEALRKITFRALWWFRFSALLTFLTGLMILGFQRALGSEFSDYFSTPGGTSIAFGALLGLTMFLNVWGVIWPNQKIFIGSAESVAAGGAEDPRAAGAAKKAGRASRANTMMSIPMLFFMGFTSHFAGRYDSDPGSSGLLPAWIVFIVVLLFIELSALGVLGGYDSPQAKLFWDTHKNTIVAGFVVWAILLFVCFEGIIGGQDEASARGGVVTPTETLDADLLVIALDIDFNADAYSLPEGEATIALVNQGNLPHNLVIELPDGFRIDTIGNAEQDTGTATFEPGSYEMFCDIAGHRAEGMEATLEVT